MSLKAVELNPFEFVTRHKVRFPFKGLISVEDLWTLSLRDLDDIFKILNKQVKQSDEESLLEEKSADDFKKHTTLLIQIEVIKHIVSVKQEEQRAKEIAAENKLKKEKIMSILASREDKALENATEEELKRLLETL